MSSPPLAIEQTPRTELRLSEVVGALSHALDLTEGQPAGHSLRCCWIGMHIGRAIGMTEPVLHDLYYTLLLKDAGCSSNAARLCQLYGADDLQTKRDIKFVDLQNQRQLARFALSHTGPEMGSWERMKLLWNLVRNREKLATEVIETRCERGADIARQLGFSEAVASGIHGLDEHWNGKGYPVGLAGEDIPLASRIALLAQVVDVFQFGATPDDALNEIRRRSGRWFDPRLVEVVHGLRPDNRFWTTLNSTGLEQAVQNLEPGGRSLPLTEEQLDTIAEAFGQVIDAKSPFTAGHSKRVGEMCWMVGEELGLEGPRLNMLRRGGLLHDIGKLAVSNTILDKPGRLTEEEWEVMRSHPLHSYEVLRRIAPFQEMARDAGAHHEKLDGTGYPWGLTGSEISLEARIITATDIFDAITADRPYREAMPREKAWKIMESLRGDSVDSDCLNALMHRLR